MNIAKIISPDDLLIFLSVGFENEKVYLTRF